jgi:hypothetical protein
MTQKRLYGFGVFFVFACVVIALACTTPVYQYSLQRWPADPYQLVVLYRDSLSASDNNLLVALDTAVNAYQPPANLVIKAVNISKPLPLELAGLLPGIAVTGSMPLVVLRYPKVIRNGKPVWTGPLTNNLVHSLVTSPARRRMADGLLQGCSGVWAFIESGAARKDTEALARLQSQNLPVVTISRADPLERITIAMLMHSELDLFGYRDQPMVFPIYGRGRALYSLVGRGIIRDNINDARRFLEGPCACEIKMQNPGTDLLMGANWNESYALFPAIEDEPVPPLSGVFAERESTGMVLSNRIPSDSTRPSEPGITPMSGMRLMSIVVGTGIVLAGVIIIASAAVIVRARKARQ